MRTFLRTIGPVTATVLALTWQTACSSDEDDEATGGKGNGGGSGGSSTGGKSGSPATGGSAGKGGANTGGNATGGNATGGSGGAGDAGGASGAGGNGTNECGRVCPDGQFCSQCFNPDDPDVLLYFCIDEGTSC